LVFLVVSFLLVFPPIFYMYSSSLPFVLHALPISSSLTWLCFAKSTSYEVPHNAVFSTSRHFISLRSKYSQHPVLKHPQSMFLP
jgi:hypothetical protein